MKHTFTISKIKDKIGHFQAILEGYRTRKKLIEGSDALSIESHGIAKIIVLLNDVIYDINRIDKKTEKDIRNKWVTLYRQNQIQARECDKMNCTLQAAFHREIQKIIDDVWFYMS